MRLPSVPTLIELGQTAEENNVESGKFSWGHWKEFWFAPRPKARLMELRSAFNEMVKDQKYQKDMKKQDDGTNDW